MRQSKDHSAYSDNVANLVYGENNQGEIVHVSHVESGIKCSLRCPLCKGRLVAHKGEKLHHHFKHHKPTNCDGGGETAIHRLAKQILQDASEVRLPDWIEYIGNGQTRPIPQEQNHTFSRIVTEDCQPEFQHTLNTFWDLYGIEATDRRFIPDAVAIHIDSHSNNIPIFIEVMYSHASEEEKIYFFKKYNLSSFEIDLSKLSLSSNPQEVKDAALSQAPRAWLNSPRNNNEESKLKKFREELAKRQAADAEHSRQQREAKLAEAERKKRIILSTIETVYEEGVPWRNDANSITAMDICFTAEPQTIDTLTEKMAAQLIARIVSETNDPFQQISYLDRWHHDFTNSVLNAIYSNNWGRTGISRYISKVMMLQVRAEYPIFSSPYHAISQHLKLKRSDLRQMLDDLPAQERHRARELKQQDASSCDDIPFPLKQLPNGEWVDDDDW